MAKPIKTILKLQLEAGKANPAPPVGTALGPHGVNIQDFCKKFNDATKDMAGDVVPAEITIYEDRSFDFKLKTPPALKRDPAIRLKIKLEKSLKPMSALLPSGKCRI